MTTKPALGSITYDDSDPVTYGGGGMNKRHPWKVSFHDWGRTAHQTYVSAAGELAKDRMYADPQHIRLTEKLRKLDEEIYQREFLAIMAEAPHDISPKKGYTTIYEGHTVCAWCYRVTIEEGHADAETARLHGCNR